MIIYLGGVWNSASLRSLPRLRLSHITADKREIKDFPKSRQGGTSFIRIPLSDIRYRNNGNNQVNAIKEGLKWENIK